MKPSLFRSRVHALMEKNDRKKSIWIALITRCVKALGISAVIFAVVSSMACSHIGI